MQKQESNTSFDFDIVSKWIKEIVNGMEYLHNVINTIHRDIKPE